MNDYFNQTINTGPNLKQGKPKGVMVIAIFIFLLAGYSIVEFIRFKTESPLAYQVSSITGGNTLTIVLIAGLILIGVGLWRLNKLALWATVVLAILIVFNAGNIIKKDIEAKPDANKYFQELIDRDNSSPLLKGYAANEEENRKISQSLYNKEIREKATIGIVAAGIAIYLLLPTTRSKF